MRKIRLKVLSYNFPVILALLLCNNVMASSNSTDYASEPRYALIIGNAQYQSLGELKNPLNDARAMRTALERTGFHVTHLENGGRRAMKQAVREFYSHISGGGIGFFFYAGHGIEVDGQNYLIASDSDLQSKADVEFETLEVNYIARMMERAGNRLNIMVLDACRNDPFSRSGSGGLAPIQEAQGMFIAFATAPGSVASDGDGENGLFTSQLISELQRPGLNLEAVFKNVRKRVIERSGSQQVPWTSSSITGDFYFVPPLPGGQSGASVASPIQVDVEQEYWNSIRHSQEVADFQAYTDAFPQGRYRMLAKLHIDRLSRKQQGTEPADQPSQTNLVLAVRFEDQDGFAKRTQEFTNQIRQAIDSRLKPGTKVIEELGTWESGGYWSTDDLFNDDNGRNHQKICDRHQAGHILSIVLQDMKYARNGKRDVRIQQYNCSDTTLRTETITTLKNKRSGQTRKAIANFSQQIP